jgi:DNA primase small subunit
MINMQSRSAQAIQRKFTQYYRNQDNRISSPLSISQREFGFILHDRKIMIRHKSFDEDTALRRFLGSTSPSDAYYSAAYYQNPTAGMDKKDWRGADLVFDIDADHIPTACGKIHDNWTCNNCNFSGKGPSPTQCPNCDKSKFDVKVWMCEKCLESAKAQTIKLIEILLEDFGFASESLKVYFSGHRGYHVHIESKVVNLLDSFARKEIVDYIIGLGFKESLHSLVKGNRVILSADSDVGWKARIAQGVYAFLEKPNPEEIKNIKLGKKTTEFLLKNKTRLLKTLKDREYIEIKGIGPKNWVKIIDLVVKKQSAKIDTVVTTDIHRLIRLAGSLHGKTGFMKVEVPLNDFEKFDPLKEAIAFKEGKMAVNITNAPKFRIEGTTYGPFKEASREELPMAAAIFLLCKGGAQVVE